jgi:hypothetical protein
MSEILHSFEENTRQAEMGKKPTSEINLAQVRGDTPTNDLDTPDKKEKNPEKRVPTIAEVQANKAKWDASMVQFAQANPDALSNQEKWPEAVRKAWLEVKQQGWPC